MIRWNWKAVESWSEEREEKARWWVGAKVQEKADFLTSEEFSGEVEVSKLGYGARVLVREF